MSDGGFSWLEAAFGELRAGRAQEALAQLERGAPEVSSRYESEWWRIRGLSLSHLGRHEEAASAFEQALGFAPPSSVQRGGVALSYGALHGALDRRREAMRAYLTARDAFRAARYDEGLVLASYNLGWSLLQLEQVEPAAEVFELALLASERRSGAVHRPDLYLGRSLVSSLRGQHGLAVRQAEWGVAVSRDLAQVRCLYRLAEAQLLAGDAPAARGALQDMLAHSACLTHRHQRNRGGLVMAGLNEDSAAVMELLKDLSGAERVKALLLLAWCAHRAGDPAGALDRLRGAVALNQPHTVALWQPLMAEVYEVGRQEGLALPSGHAAKESRTVQLRLTGVLEVTVGGFTVALRLTPQAAAIGAFLSTSGPASTERLISQALGAGSSRDVHRAAQRLCLVIGDAAAVVAPEKNGGVWRMSPVWDWQVAGHGPGRFLGGLDSPFTREWHWD